MNTGYHCGNSLEVFPLLEYDYLWISPPCYEDLKSLGVDLKHPETYKTKFLDSIIPAANPKLGTITVAFTGSRRNGGRILAKLYFLQQCMFENGYYLRDVKHVKKSDSYNAYSSQCIDVYTFQRNNTKSVYNLQKDKLYQTYGKDVWGPFNKELVIDGEVVGQPIEIARYCIANFTNPGDLVLDIFAGLGTSLAAARDLGRKYLGYELRPVIHTAGKQRYGL